MFIFLFPLGFHVSRVKLFLAIMNPFTAAVAGGALTVGNNNPRPTRRLSTGQNAQSESREGEHKKLEDKQHRSKMQDQNEAGQQPHDKQERECIIL